MILAGGLACGPPATPTPPPLPTATPVPTRPAATATSAPSQPVATPTAVLAAATKPAAGEQQVAMQNISFQPQQIAVTPGTSVVWTNRDGFPHTVTSGTRGNPTGKFDSGSVPSGGTFRFTFREPGTYEYFCQFHPGMSGAVVVQP